MDRSLWAWVVWLSWRLSQSPDLGAMTRSAGLRPSLSLQMPGEGGCSGTCASTSHYPRWTSLRMLSCPMRWLPMHSEPVEETIGVGWPEVYLRPTTLLSSPLPHGVILVGGTAVTPLWAPFRAYMALEAPCSQHSTAHGSSFSGRLPRFTEVT